jgi:isoquinoline 1-oxidoreductase beta subunit
VLVEYVRHETPAVTVGFWRGVGPNSSVFSAECFLDLLARRSHVDPLAFRRNMLQGNPRALRVLELAAAKARWGTPTASSSSDARIGQGIALLAGFGSFLAAVVEVAVADDGDVRVRRIVCAADVGVIVNPDTVVAQIQGGTIFGLGTILYDAITVADGRVQQSNFHDFRLPRIDDIPVIETHLVPGNDKPGGIGEPGTVVVQPAIANAVFAATGIQPTRMPIDREQQARRKS